MSFGSVLRRGVLAGVCAGLSSALVTWVAVEPVIRQALDIEAARTEVIHGGGQSLPLRLPAHGGGEEPLVSRAVQVVGGAMTSVLVGVAVGVIFAIVYARVRERLSGRGDLVGSLTLAAVGFGGVSLLPALVVPANPPAVGDPTTVGHRTMLYAVTLLLGVAVPIVVVAVDRRLSMSSMSTTTRLALDVVVAAVLLVGLVVLLPGSPDVVPDDVPADLLWDFRVASLAQLAAMWLTLGLVFGVLMERAATGDRTLAPVAA